jgi:hypothetical protein
MATLQDRINGAMAEMNQICKQYKDDPAAQLIELMLQGQTVLMKHGMGGYAVIHSMKTVIHPRNRGSNMLDQAEVPTKVADISDVAFSLHEVAQAAAVRMPPVGTAARTAIEAKNIELSAAAMGHLAPVVQGDAEVMVVGCSHNTAGLKAINAKAKCDIERISDGGHYSASKIIGRCPSYKEPIENGLKYFVMDYPVEEHWPLYVDLTIEASNVGSALAKPDNVVQLMCKAHAQTLRTPNLSHEKLAQMMARSKPALESMLPSICKYIEMWSGGQVPTFLNQIVAFSRTLTAPKFDNIDATFLDGLCNIHLGTGMGARYRVMVCELVLVHSGLFTSREFSKLNGNIGGTSSHIQNRGSMKELIQKIEEGVVQFERHASKLLQVKGQGTVGALVHRLGLLDIDAIGYIHNLSKKFKTLDDMYMAHFDELLKDVGGTAKNPYRVTAEPKLKAATACGALQEVGALGLSYPALYDKLLEKGFTVGVRVQTKAAKDTPPTVYIIIALEVPEKGTIPRATMTEVSDKRKKTTAGYQKLIDQYELAPAGEMVLRPLKAARTHPAIRVA